MDFEISQGTWYIRRSHFLWSKIVWLAYMLLTGSTGPLLSHVIHSGYNDSQSFVLFRLNFTVHSLFATMHSLCCDSVAVSAWKIMMSSVTLKKAACGDVQWQEGFDHHLFSTRRYMTSCRRYMTSCRYNCCFHDTIIDVFWRFLHDKFPCFMSQLWLAAIWLNATCSTLRPQMTETERQSGVY